MAGFAFQSSILKLDIAGNKFTLDTGRRELKEKCERFATGALEKAGALDNNPDAGEQEVKEATQYVLSAIDSILGDGASEKIFRDRIIDLIDATEVIIYIFEEVGKARQARLVQYTPNREQRRRKK